MNVRHLAKSSDTEIAIESGTPLIKSIYSTRGAKDIEKKNKSKPES
jgi:hypothetical protein